MFEYNADAAKCLELILHELFHVSMPFELNRSNYLMIVVKGTQSNFSIILGNVMIDHFYVLSSVQLIFTFRIPQGRKL